MLTPSAIRQTVQRAGLVLLLAVSVFLTNGCSKPLALVDVSGNLKMNGKPLGNVKVEFQPDPDQDTRGPGSWGITDESGNFKLTCSNGKAGAMVGFHRVVLTDLTVYGNTFVGRGDYRHEESGGKSREVPKKARFAQTYTELANTTLKQEVKEGMGPVAFEIK